MSGLFAIAPTEQLGNLQVNELYLAHGYEGISLSGHIP